MSIRTSPAFCPSRPCVGKGDRKFYASVVVPQFLPGFLAKEKLPRVSRQSRLYEIKPKGVHISPVIYLTVEEHSSGVLPKGIPSNGVPYRHMRSVGSHSTSRGRKGLHLVVSSKISCRACNTIYTFATCNLDIYEYKTCCTLIHVLNLVTCQNIERFHT